MSTSEIFGIDPTNRRDVPANLKNGGFEASADGSKSIHDKYLNEILFKSRCDYLYGTLSELTATPPTASMYTDVNGKAKTLNESTGSIEDVVFNEFDRIIITKNLAESLTDEIKLDTEGVSVLLTSEESIYLADGVKELIIRDANKSVINLTSNSIDIKQEDSSSWIDVIEINTSQEASFYMNGVKLIDNSLSSGSGMPQTLTAQVNYPQHGKGYRNLKVSNRPGFTDTQLEFSFDYVTLFSDNGESSDAYSMNYTVKYLNSGTLRINNTTTGLNGRAASENGGALLSNAWYYIYLLYNPLIADDSSVYVGTFMSLNSNWNSINPADKPAGYTFQRRISACRVDGSGDFELFTQNESIVAINVKTSNNVGSFGAHGVTVRDVSVLVPETAFIVIGYQRDTTSNCTVLSSNQVFTNQGVGSNFTGGSNNFDSFEVLSKNQEIYTQSNGGTQTVSITHFELSI